MMHHRRLPSHHHNHQLSLRRRLAKNPELAHKLHQMALPLSPLVQLTTGAVHPHFPRTVLQFWLLTDAQLESLAQFYHQRTPSPLVSAAPLEEKRRKMGRFIGLRGCESPTIVLKSEEQIARDASRNAADEDALRRKMNPFSQQ
ncbi:hypothetical protein TrVGV298_000793 [Trichoderma virens]|nr:hypothetical protein TrVGV298_000793 [Trichoderma virens]